MARDKRPRDYWTSPDGLLRIAGWASDGLTVQEIADQIGTAKRTLLDWSSKNPDLKTALANNRDAADRAVENQLRKTALGYEYEETKTTIEITPEGDRKQKIEKFKRYAKPDSVAAIFYLKNRKPETWRDSQQLDLKATVGLVQIVDDIPKKIIEGDATDGTARITDRSDRA